MVASLFARQATIGPKHGLYVCIRAPLRARMLASGTGTGCDRRIPVDDPDDPNDVDDKIRTCQVVLPELDPRG